MSEAVEKLALILAKINGYSKVPNGEKGYYKITAQTLESELQKLGYLPVEPVEVYYSPRVNRLFSVISRVDDGLLCTGFCNFYGDATRNIQRQILSDDFISECIQIGAVDKCPYLEPSPITGSWKVKEVNSERD